MGPTGASSIVNASILGPLFATWGLVAGYRIINGARDAHAYLSLISKEIAKVEIELQSLQSAAGNVEAPATIDAIAQRLKVLADFRSGVQRAAAEQRFNQTVPGFIQLGASVGIMAVGINSIPTLANASPLLSATGSLALGVVSGGALCVYGGLSLARSLTMALRAWSRPKRDVHTASKPQERAYLKAYNARVGLHRLFHSLNSISWAGFVGGCGCMIGVAAGAALSHGAVIAAVVITALSVVIWDKLWGERCAPRNAMTPHIDRNHLHTVAERADLWSLLDKEGQAKERLQRDMLAALPPNVKGPAPAGRYKYFWRHIPMVGGVKRLASWVATANTDKTNLVLLDYLVEHMANEKRFFAGKLALHKAAAKKRLSELSRLEGGTPLDLKRCVDYDKAITCELAARLLAVDALHAELQSVHHDATENRMRPAQTQVNRLLAAFIAVNGLENDVFSGRDVERDNLSFDAPMRPATWFAKQRPAHIALTARGVQAIEFSGLTDKQRARLMKSLLSDRQQQYELDALFNIEADQVLSV